MFHVPSLVHMPCRVLPDLHDDDPVFNVQYYIHGLFANASLRSARRAAIYKSNRSAGFMISFGIVVEASRDMTASGFTMVSIFDESCGMIDPGSSDRSFTGEDWSRCIVVESWASRETKYLPSQTLLPGSLLTPGIARPIISL